MLYRWDLIKKDWGYIIVDKSNNIDVVNELQSKLEEKTSLVREFAKRNNELDNRVDELEKELHDIRENWINPEDNPVDAGKIPYQSIQTDISEEDRINWEYYEWKNNEKKEIIDAILNDIYTDMVKRGIREEESSFKQRMYEKYWYSPRED